MKLLFALILFVAVHQTYGQRKLTLCGEEANRDAEEVVKKILTFGDSGRRFPEKVEELPKYCR